MPEDITPEPWTRAEIRQQPATLEATQAILAGQADALEAFLRPLLADPRQRIVLTGAGTSAFIGECLAPWLGSRLGRSVEAISTTDLVSAPGLFLRADAPTLLVSFGRSGNSPESLAAVRQVDARVAEASHLVITCNPDGELAQLPSLRRHVVLLPEETHDRGFAMTSSFTAMTYAALSIFTGVAAMGDRIGAIRDAVAQVLADAAPLADRLAAAGFERVVYLGSGLFHGLAHEAALKLLELTDGALVTAFETPMGFRHGPKTIVNDRSLVVVFLSNDPLTRRYDLDLVRELQRDGRAGEVVTVAATGDEPATLRVRHLDGATDAELLFPYIVPAQLFALACSVALGLTPDRPNASGTVNRVVEGVRIYATAA